ncbi:hypothetical protein M0811_11223 [Anaeramoeba ignava]|uniref:Sucrose transporter n=1 Tax=Anaeramoeba ignava TaxID=1746090 RepID=A0A9Q0R7N1_ANAIG|nr:hypothetical protein M0811_11223 [Anaeramoeba ignava]
MSEKESQNELIETDTDINESESENENENKKIPKRSWQKLLLLSICLAGVIFAYAQQIGQMTAFFRELGLSQTVVSIIWVAGPISGFLVQPLVGIWSDRSTSRWGRRRPFLLGGAIFVVLSEILVSNSRDLGSKMGDTPSHNPAAITLAVIGFWIMDLANNTLQGPSRALLADWAPDYQQKLGSAFFSLWVGVGNVGGYFSGSVDWSSYFSTFETSNCKNACANLRFSFMIGGIIILTTNLITLFAIKEERFIKSKNKNKKAPNPFTMLFKGITKQPKWFKLVNLVNFLSWIGWYCFFMYGTDWFGSRIYNGKPKNPCPDYPKHSDCLKYEKGVARGSLALTFESGLCLILSPFVPRIIDKIGIKITYFIGQVVFGIVLCLTVFVRNEAVAMIMFAFVGIPLATTMIIPYTIIGKLAPKKDNGLFMGIRNLFVVIPQLIVSLTMGALVSHPFKGNSSWAMFVGGIFEFVGAGCVFLLIVDKSELSVEEKKKLLENENENENGNENEIENEIGIGIGIGIENENENEN